MQSYRIWYNIGKRITKIVGHTLVDPGDLDGTLYVRPNSIEFSPAYSPIKNNAENTFMENIFISDSLNEKFIGWSIRIVSEGGEVYLLENGKYVRCSEYNPSRDGARKLFRPGEIIPYLPFNGLKSVVAWAVWTVNDYNEEKEKFLKYSPEHASENKKILYENLLHRPIVLFGGGNVCKIFYQRYHKILKIRCILTDKKKEENIQLDDTGIKVESYSKEKIFNGDYIIVCQPVRIWGDEEYKDARSILTRDGFYHAKDFIRSDIASAILDKKRIWLWMGYCQFEILVAIFNKIKRINQEFAFNYMRPGLHTVKTSHRFQDCQDMLKICDILIYTPILFNEKKVDFDFNDFLPKDAVSLSIPRIAFRGYYPYKDDNIEAYHKYTFDNKIHYPFKYEEIFLDELILQGLNDDEIYRQIMREDFIDEKTIQNNLKLAFMSIQISENTADIKILDYIKGNYTDHMLYRDGLHYQNDLYFELARRVSRYLDLDVVDEIDNLEGEVKNSGIQYHDTTEIPVLPCVAKALGLDFITDDTLWRVRFTENGQDTAKYEIRMLTRKEWIYAYLAYTRAHMTLRKLWNLNNDD